MYLKRKFPPEQESDPSQAVDLRGDVEPVQVRVQLVVVGHENVFVDVSELLVDGGGAGEPRVRLLFVLEWFRRRHRRSPLLAATAAFG